MAKWIKFRDLPIGSVFRFSGEIEFPYSGIARGPWVKTGLREYHHVDRSYGPLGEDLKFRVGSINAQTQLETKQNPAQDRTDDPTLNPPRLFLKTGSKYYRVQESKIDSWSGKLMYYAAGRWWWEISKGRFQMEKYQGERTKRIGKLVESDEPLDIQEDVEGRQKRLELLRTKQNPSRSIAPIGQAVEVRYKRTGRKPGFYKHTMETRAQVYTVPAGWFYVPAKSIVIASSIRGRN